ncbi:acetyl-CoA synthetase [Halolamina salifodinae]|uniref:Non-ribosomal peptide synthetase component E (Peptide arylation enzyme) n=1 Tax=Halolamina salifodinae TaxID=1202767 RepID=A0A8T4GZB6_9EURY|nr:acetyl-CoA synthetase [Halolamina salifodinae]MBP1986715.1 non-ribosomal peptide synthetase component E (peptide arylation enzyme) [Halolamina salifodinae]
MDVVGDLLARERRSDRPALYTAEREMDYRRFCTTTWKASNYLRHLGVGDDRGVVVLADGSPPPLLTFFGAALLATPTRFADDIADVSAAVDAIDARAVLVSSEDESAVDPPAGTTLTVHGDAPAAATTENWEEGVWSENPAFVSTATPASTVLVTPNETVSHGELLTAGERIAAEFDLGTEDTVHVQASLADPRAVAGVVAPLSVGGAVRFGEEGEDGDVTVGEGGDIPLSSISLSPA